MFLQNLKIARLFNIHTLLKINMRDQNLLNVLILLQCAIELSHYDETLVFKKILKGHN